MDMPLDLSLKSKLKNDRETVQENEFGNKQNQYKFDNSINKYDFQKHFTLESKPSTEITKYNSKIGYNYCEKDNSTINTVVPLLNIEEYKNSAIEVSTVNKSDEEKIYVKKQHKNLLPCDVCKKTFDRPSLLKRHIRTHTGEKPHICETCNKGFSTSSSLNTHRRIHTGLKPHVCGHCGKRFTASSNLYYHRMTHTKVKPHKCTLCTKSFPTPGDLRSHTYVHSGTWPFRCPVCFRGFSKQTNLKNHVAMHTGDRPYFCKICNKKFALQCNLKAHLKIHHGNNDNCNLSELPTPIEASNSNDAENGKELELQSGTNNITLNFMPDFYKNMILNDLQRTITANFGFPVSFPSVACGFSLNLTQN